MTKPEVDSALRCHLQVENVGENAINSVTLCVNNIADKNSSVVCGHGVLLDETPRVNVNVSRVKKARVRRSRLGKITEKLYNLECDDAPEKPLKIELDLYQMET